MLEIIVNTLNNTTKLVEPVTSIVSPVADPSFGTTINNIIRSYPAVPKPIIIPVAFLATLAGWGVFLWLAVHIIVILEVITEWRVYHHKYKLTPRAWTQKITNKLIGYIALALLASALSWVAVEIKSASNLAIPQWVFMLTPNGAGVWIIFASAQVIKDNIKLLGVPLPGLVSK